jgi:hypothetical protein
MLDITSAPNHTSAAQLAGWKQIMRCALVDTYNASPLGQADPIDLDEFITWLTSLGTDHANDQLLLAKLKREWKITAQKIMLGKKYLASTDLQTYLPLIQSFNDAKIEAAGGLDSWNALPKEEKTWRDINVVRAISQIHSITYFGLQGLSQSLGSFWRDTMERPL